VGLVADDSWYVNQRVARLAPGATVARANAEVKEHARRMQERLPTIFDDEEVATATVQPLHDFVAGGTGSVLWVAFGAVSLVLVMACANVANLLLARGEARGRDLAVRAALGAGRRRVAFPLLAESGLLSVSGGALGVALAYGLVSAAVRLAPEDFPRIAEVGVSRAVLVFALAATVLTTVVAGLVPALRASRVDATASLGSSVRGTGRRVASPVSAALVGIQVALAVVVAVGSGLMLRSLGALLAVDAGLVGEGVLTFRPNPPGGRYPDGEAFLEYYDRVTERVAAVPGVESVGAIHLLPGTENNWSFPTFPEGVDIPAGSPVPSVNFRAVRPGYFETLRIPLRTGRLLGAADRADSEPVALVNEAFVARFWPGEDPLGRTVSYFRRDGTAYRVVGVVADVRQHDRAAEPRPEMYYAHAQVPWNQMAMWIMARVRTGAPLDYAEAVRAAVWDVDADVPIAGMDDMSAVLGRSTRTMRFLAFLLTGFGLLALILGGIGVFGVTAYTVGRRLPEFGVRIALGSSRAQVLGTALLHGVVPVALGLVAGMAAAALSADLLESVLYGVTPRDPWAFAGVAGLFGVVALVATMLPAWRASRLDPVAVLSKE
jgi:putative ABC transport system permease protein